MIITNFSEYIKESLSTGYGPNLQKLFNSKSKFIFGDLVMNFGEMFWYDRTKSGKPQPQDPMKLGHNGGVYITLSVREDISGKPMPIHAYAGTHLECYPKGDGWSIDLVFGEYKDGKEQVKERIILGPIGDKYKKVYDVVNGILKKYQVSLDLGPVSN